MNMKNLKILVKNVLQNSPQVSCSTTPTRSYKSHIGKIVGDKFSGKLYYEESELGVQVAVDASYTVEFMKGWSEKRVIAYCQRRGWSYESRIIVATDTGGDVGC